MPTLSFNGVIFDAQTIQNQTYITSVQLAEALGYTRSKVVTNIYRRNKEEFTLDMTFKPICSAEKGESPRQFSLRGAHRIPHYQ